MLEVLIVASGLFVLLLLMLTSHFLIEYTVQSEILDLGNYTSAYRCKNCNSVYSGNQIICGTCGYENEMGMAREIGKWHRRISKLGVEYWWEPKNDQKTTKDFNRDGIL
jgi:hypothetical protein